MHEDRRRTGTVVSVNVGRSTDWPWEGRTVRTAFLKRPVAGRVRVDPLGLAGDEVADHVAHGGLHKAVYAYPSEHYPFWSKTLGRTDLAWGSLGENLTLEGLTEDQVAAGDRLEGPDVVFLVRQPRTPCYKLNVRFARPDVLERFARSARPGFYLEVARAGWVSAGDRLELVPADGRRTSIREIYVDRMRAAGDPSDSENDGS